MTIKINGDNSVANPGFSGNDTDTGLQVGTNELKLVTGGSEAVTVNSSQNVGIGTTSPTNQLHIYDSAAANDQAELKIESFRPGIRFQDRSSSSASGEIIGDNGLKFNVSTPVDDDTALTERMRIASDGNVGIGTTSPSQKLEVAGAVVATGAASTYSSTGLYIQNKGSSVFDVGAWRDGASVAELSFSTDSGSDTAPVEHMRISSGGNVGIGTSSPSSKLDVVTTGTGAETVMEFGNANISRGLQVQTTDGNLVWGFNALNSRSLAFSTNQTERMRIDSSGAVRLSNPTANPSLGSNTIGVQVSGGVLIVNSSSSGSVFGRNNNGAVMFFQRNGTSVGTISVSTTNTAYNTSSDYRLKENVIDLDGAIDRVKQLAPKRFNFIADSDTTVDGFLAHEAQTVVPEAVTGTHNEVDDDGEPVMQGIDQSKLVPLLTAALQEAIAKIETLETQNADLLARVTALENV